MDSSSSSLSSSSSVVPRCKHSSNFLYTRPINETTMANQLTCVLEDGSRVYLKRAVSRDIRSNEITNKRGEIHTSGNLLSKSMEELLNEAKDLQTASLANRAQKEDKLLKELDVSLGDDEEDLGGLLSQEMHTDLEEMEKLDERMNQSNKGLWVDKYSPKEFSQLLSPEKINREALKALRQWDKFVFGSKKKKSTDLIDESPSKMSPIFNRKRDDDIREGSDLDDDFLVHDDDLDDDGSDGEDFIRRPKASTSRKDDDIRPLRKVILLCGPPGTGKTTLAHVIAKHCGYRPHEVNASDDRSAAAIRVTMEQAMHGRTLDAERRPNCIIMDEIDGIDGRAGIDALLSIVNRPLKEEKKKKKSSGLPLTRPLICICNDQYAPSLKELRKMAQVYVFTPPSELKLVQRLKNVCISEGLHVNTTALTTLSQAAGNDIRSAINTLQFASMRGRKELKKREGSSNSAASSTFVSDISKILNSMILNGLKDEQRDIFTVWNEIFNTKAARVAVSRKQKKLEFGQEYDSLEQLDSSRRGVSALDSLREASGGTVKSSATSKNYETMMHVVRCCEEYNDNMLITNGTFEYYLRTRSNDPTFTKTQKVSDWLSFGDQLDYFNIQSGYGYSVSAYQSSVHGAVHILCATEHKMKLSWPSQSRDAYFKHQQRTNIIQSVVESLASTATSMTKQDFAVDVVASVADILSPKIDVQRGGSLSRLQTEDIDNLFKVSQIMKKFGLSFVKQSHEVVSQNVCYRCNQTGHYANNCPTLLTGAAAVDNIFTTLKNQVDPAIHQLLAYDVSSKNTDVALGKSDVLSDLENLTIRSQCRVVSVDIQKGIRAAEEMKKKQAYSTPSILEGHTPVKDFSEDYDAPMSSGKRPLQTWDTNKPMTVEGIEALNAAKKSKGGPKGRINAFFSKKPAAAGKDTKVVGAKRDALERDNVGSLYYTKHKIKFKFEQGFSMAVRRPVDINEFF